MHLDHLCVLTKAICLEHDRRPRSAQGRLGLIPSCAGQRPQHLAG